MKLFKNSSEAEAGITVFIKKIPIQFEFHSTSFRLKFSGWIFRDAYFLNSFNRLVRTESSYTFSYLTTDEIKSHQKAIKTCIEALNKKIDTIHYEGATTPHPTNSVRKESGFIDVKLITSIFSSDFIKQNDLSPENIITLVHASREKQQNLIDEQEPVSILRWQEIREDLRTILSISPVDGTMQLSYCFLKDRYKNERALSNFNPISGYYGNRFVYEPVRFNRYISKHGLRFIEIQGYAQSPQNELNEQVIQITYNNYSKGTMDSIACSSYRSLKKESKLLFALLTLIYGIDIYRRHQKSLPMDAQSEVQSEAAKSLIPIMGKCLDLKKSIIGKTSYYSPETDIHISYTPTFEKDDEESDFVVFQLKIQILPFDPNHPEKTKTYLHPIIYEADK
jgi:hypothetical protein